MSEDEYNILVSMFESEGWKLYTSQVEETEEAQTKGAVDGAPDNDSWQWLRGYLTCARGVLGYESFVRLSYEAQLEDAKEERMIEDENAYV